jgi:hypothetical protein
MAFGFSAFVPTKNTGMCFGFFLPQYPHDFLFLGGQLCSHVDAKIDEVCSGDRFFCLTLHVFFDTIIGVGRESAGVDQ